jgi:hypothetical protein
MIPAILIPVRKNKNHATFIITYKNTVLYQKVWIMGE